MDDLDREEATALFWILGQLLGQAVAQKWDGTMLYHVRDTGQPYSYGVRGSTTNVELGFHTDNAFGVAPPDSVGLLCINPSREGGVSRFCSLYTVHNRLLGRYPRALERLYRPLFWDRQAEHAPGRPKVARAPMFGFDGRRLRSRVNVSLVRKGYDIAGEAMDPSSAARGSTAPSRSPAIIRTAHIASVGCPARSLSVSSAHSSSRAGWPSFSSTS